MPYEGTRKANKTGKQNDKEKKKKAEVHLRGTKICELTRMTQLSFNLFIDRPLLVVKSVDLLLLQNSLALLTASIIHGSMLIYSSAIDRGTSSIVIFQRHLFPTDLWRVLRKGFSPLGETWSPQRMLQNSSYVPSCGETRNFIYNSLVCCLLVRVKNKSSHLFTKKWMVLMLKRNFVRFKTVLFFFKFA